MHYWHPTHRRHLNISFLTRLVIVEHEEEVDQPGKFYGLEHLANKAQLAEVNDKPRLLLRNLPQGKMFHGRYEILQHFPSERSKLYPPISDLFSEDVILQLDVESSPVLGVHHKEAEVQSLLRPPSDSLHVVPESLFQ